MHAVSVCRKFSNASGFFVLIVQLCCILLYVMCWQGWSNQSAFSAGRLMKISWLDSVLVFLYANCIAGLFGGCFPYYKMWVDVAFDVLYVGDTSVIHQSLKERHELLRKVVKPIKGSLEILVPNGGLNAHRAPGKHLTLKPIVWSYSLNIHFIKTQGWTYGVSYFVLEGWMVFLKERWQWLFTCMYVNIKK